MYSELSTQFQYNESEFKSAKTYEMLKVFCPVCSTIFEQTKHQIRTNWRRSPSKILYCTRTCSMLGRSKIERETDNCLHCNKEFERITTNIKSVNKKFCSKSCSATYMNLNRTKEERDEISRKVSAKLRKELTPKLLKPIKKIMPEKVKTRKIKKQIKYFYKKLHILTSNVYTFNYSKTYITSINLDKYYLSYCKGCDKPLIGLTKRRNICINSKSCFKLLMRKVHEEKPHLILNRSNPESYLEKSFREYIENKGYIKGDTFIQEKQWKLSSGKRYISDFYFPDLNLIVEMDGKQHQDTVVEDELKDSLLKEEFNLDTIRITHKQWRYKEKAKVLESVL